MSLGEFELIARYFTRPQDRSRGAVALGVGDDCALINSTPGMQWVVSTDLLVEGRHFLSTVAPERLGHKSLAVNLSDLAACGAHPRAFLLSLSMPRVDETFLDGFARGLFALADEQQVVLAGGDTTAGPLTVSITVMGEVPTGQALRRNGASVGDDIWVSHPAGGGLGDARLALEVFRGRLALEGQAFEHLRMSMEQPQPRVELGIALRGVASAAIDLSDGLMGDLQHVLRQSQVAAQIELDALPRSALMKQQDRAMQLDGLLYGGDDYELLFTAPASLRQEVLGLAKVVNDAALLATRGAGATGIAVARIGCINPATAGGALITVLDGDGQTVHHSGRAFDHFLS